MAILRNVLISALGIGVAAWIIPGVVLEPVRVAIVVAVILAVVNALIGNLLRILTFPITILTLGLWSFVISILMIMLVAAIVPGFETGGFWMTVLFGIVLALINMGLRFMKK